MQNLQQLYETSVRPLPVNEQIAFVSLILNQLAAPPKPENHVEPRRSALNIIEEMPGGRIFKTSAEADAYLREERDSWER